jgi:hypothetical protein
LGERYALESEVPHDLKELVRFSIASGWLHIQPVFGPPLETLADRRRGKLFPERRTVLSGNPAGTKDPKLKADFLSHVRMRLLLKPAGEAMLARLRMAEGPAPLLERVLAALSPQQCRLMEYLWPRKTAGYDALTTVSPAAGSLAVRSLTRPSPRSSKTCAAGWRRPASGTSNSSSVRPSGE